VAGAVALALLGPGILSREPADDASATHPPAPPATADADEAEAASTGSPQLSDASGSPEEPQGLGARLLEDSDGARRNLLGMSIRDAGYDCPEVRAADTLAPGGHAWRANCGALRLYWIEIDEFGRMSVEPGTYNESEFGIDAAGGERTITIQRDELPE
jgi:hypothetical protein